MTSSPATKRWIRRSCVAVVTVGLMAMGLSPASAHVTSEVSSTAAGGYTHIIFSVLTESNTASTNRVTMTLPKDTPLASVRTEPVKSWTAGTTEPKLDKPVQAGAGAIT